MSAAGPSEAALRTAAPSPFAYFASATLKAFNTNKTSWIGLVVFLIVVVAAILAPVLAPFDPNDQNILEKLRAPTARALARHRQLRPRHAVAPALRRAHFADHRRRFDTRRDGHRNGDRHAGGVARRPPRYRHDAGDGRPAGVPVADPGPDPGGDARPLDGEHHHRHRVDVDPAVCPHRPRADDRDQGARVRRRRPRARLLRHPASSSSISCRTSCPKSW